MYFRRSEFHTKKAKGTKVSKMGLSLFFLISSETIRPFGTKLCRNVHFMVPWEVYASCSSEVKYRNKRPKGVKKCVVGCYLWSVYFSTNLEKYFFAHLAKGNVGFCHHLASVDCRPLTFHIFILSSETLSKMN